MKLLNHHPYGFFYNDLDYINTIIQQTISYIIDQNLYWKYDWFYWKLLTHDLQNWCTQMFPIYPRFAIIVVVDLLPLESLWYHKGIARHVTHKTVHSILQCTVPHHPLQKLSCEAVFFTYQKQQINVLIRFKDIMPCIPKIAKFMGQTWGPPGSCGPQMGPMYLVSRLWYHASCTDSSSLPLMPLTSQCMVHLT